MKPSSPPHPGSPVSNSSPLLPVCPSHATTITVPQLRSERPPVLAAAEGDEHLGENAGQFADLDASGRQALIDKKSPAQTSN